MFKQIVQQVLLVREPQALISLDDIILLGYYSVMIRGFRDRETEKVFHGRFSRKLPHDIQRIAERKLILLHTSATLADLRVPPSNRLEALKGKRKGQYSIRINDQWRICFEWREDGVYEVEIADYH
jgi:proteic killer suppression protein